MKNPWIARVLWTLLGIFLVFFALNRHARSGRFNYHSEIWADKAGYQIFLSAFEYGWDAREVVDTSLVRNTGYGFEIDPKTGTFITKYTYGTALAQAPFYLIGHFLEGEDEAYPGFSVIQNRMASLAAAIYLFVGLLLLAQFLAYYFSKKVLPWVLLILLFGTNLLYYGSIETGMSHVYSFAVFAGLLLFIKRCSFFKREAFWEFLVFGLLSGWIVMLRQSNILFPLVFFFLDAASWVEIQERFKRMFRVKNLLGVLLGGIVLLLPQILYWNYAFESMLAYSYGEEGFKWLHPKTIRTFFDPYNGLFIYMPIMFFILYWMIRMARQKVMNGALTLGVFIVISYMFSCWWAWWFGCAFGQRSYVEYLTLLSIPLAYGLSRLKQFKTTSRYILIGLLLTSCLYTSKMAMSMDHCFEGSKNWDWKTYETLFFAPMK